MGRADTSSNHGIKRGNQNNDIKNAKSPLKFVKDSKRTNDSGSEETSRHFLQNAMKED